jgi:hypothetical protein
MYDHSSSIVYYPGLHTNLMADAGNYMLMTVYMTLSLFPFTVDRPFLRDTASAPRWPWVPLKILLPMRMASVCSHAHRMYLGVVAVCYFPSCH